MRTTSSRKDQSLQATIPSGNIRIPAVAVFFHTLCCLVALGGGIGWYRSGLFTAFWAAVWGATWYLVGLYLLLAIKVAAQWEKAVILRLGRFRKLAGPGLFWVIPVLDSVPIWIDHRVMVTPFSAEKTLTKDTVPVDVDAVLFWVVWDAEKAALGSITNLV